MTLNEAKYMKCKRNVENRLTKHKCYIVYVYYNFKKNKKQWYVIDDKGLNLTMDIADKFKLFDKIKVIA